MEVKVIKDEKNELDIELDNLTVAELLRVYLNKNDAKVAAWKRDHPTKNPVLHIESDNPKKNLKNAVSQIEKEIESVLKEFRKLN
jgi:DNA-directed RNA polymerase subunit L